MPEAKKNLVHSIQLVLIEESDCLSQLSITFAQLSIASDWTTVDS